jgi:hypothetical protein
VIGLHSLTHPMSTLYRVASSKLSAWRILLTVSAQHRGAGTDVGRDARRLFIMRSSTRPMPPLLTSHKWRKRRRTSSCRPSRAREQVSKATAESKEQRLCSWAPRRNRVELGAIVTLAFMDYSEQMNFRQTCLNHACFRKDSY